MKFLIEKTVSSVTKDTVVILRRDEDYFKNGYDYDVKYVAKVLVKVREDFDASEDFVFVRSDSSIQYRPKSLHSNTKGVFYKNGSSRMYLNGSEERELEEFIKKAKDYILQNKKEK